MVSSSLNTEPLFKPKRDVVLLSSSLLNAPAFWVFSPDRSARSLLAIVVYGWVLLISVYAFNRLTEIAPGKRAMTSHKVLLVALFVSFCPGLLWLPNDLARIAAVAYMANGLLYSIRFPRRGKPPLQLKNLYLLKPTMVAGGHALQWIIFTGRSDAVVLLLTLWHFLDLSVMTSLLDLADVRQDTQQGVRTFAVVHGFRRTLEIAMVLNVLCMVTAAAVIFVGAAWPLALFLLPRAVSTQLRVVRLYRRKMIPGRDQTWMRVVGVCGVVLYWLTHR